jgi:beta-lactamase class A
MPARRQVLSGVALLLLGGCGGGRFATTRTDWRVDHLRTLEAEAQGRLGAFVLDTRTTSGFGWREHERFAHCSSFKLSLAAMVLSLADRNELALDEVLHWSRQDMLPVSPVTSTGLERGLTPVLG